MLRFRYKVRRPTVERQGESERAGGASGDTKGVAVEEDLGYGRASSCRRRR